MNVLQAMPAVKRVGLETVLEKRDFSYGAVWPVLPTIQRSSDLVVCSTSNGSALKGHPGVPS